MSTARANNHNAAEEAGELEAVRVDGDLGRGAGGTERSDRRRDGDLRRAPAGRRGVTAEETEIFVARRQDGEE
jgi:hypothetical protein